MSRLGIRWVVLYFLSILVPAALLAFLSVRSLRDVHDSVQRELRSKAALVQDAFDRSINSRANSCPHISKTAQWNPRLYAGFSEIAQIFAVAPTGVLLHPVVQPLRLQERSAAFAAQIAKAEEREFGHQDWAGGVQLYRQAWRKRPVPQRKPKPSTLSPAAPIRERTWRQSKERTRRWRPSMAKSSTPTELHPATLSHLRLGRYAAPEQAQASLMAWTEALLEGRYPLYAGCQQALQETPRVGPRATGRHGGPSRSAGKVGPDRESP